MEDQRIVKTVDEYLEWVNEVVDPAGNFAFRGQGDAGWHLDCSAARRIRKLYPHFPQKNPDSFEKFVQYHRENLILPAKSYGFASNNGRELGDLEILAKLQHLGAATCLVDFTRSSLIALWMACKVEEKQPHGKVFAVNLSDETKFEEFTLSDAQGKNNLEGFLHHPDESALDSISWYWEPSLDKDIVSRILRQHSLFIFGYINFPKEIIVGDVEISEKNKESIRETLESQHNLSKESLFRDIHEFAVANNWRSSLRSIKALQPIKIYRAYLGDGRKAYREKDFEAAIDCFTKTADLQPQRAEVYFSRAHAKAALGQSEENGRQNFKSAIEDYDKALSNIQHMPAPLGLRSAIHYNRGNLRAQLGDLEGAVQDYTECIDAEDNANLLIGHLFYNRANVYFKMEQWSDASEDYKKAIDHWQNVRDAHYVRDAHFNLGNTYVEEGSYQDAVKHYSEALRVDESFDYAGQNRAATRALLGELELAAREFEEYGDQGANKMLIEKALAGESVKGSLAYVGNAGNVGQIGFYSLEEGRGFPGFPGYAGFAKEFCWPRDKAD